MGTGPFLLGIDTAVPLYFTGYVRGDPWTNTERIPFKGKTQVLTVARLQSHRRRDYQLDSHALHKRRARVS